MITQSEKSQPPLQNFINRILQKTTTPEYKEGSETAYTFSVNKRQANLIDKFIVEHNKDCTFADPNKCGSIGGRFTYEFCKTYLGQVIKFKCECGASVDVSDYDEW